MPVIVRELTAVTFLQPGARIAATRFDELQLDRAVGLAFDADQIEQSCGSPFSPVQPRAWALDESFLSQLLLKELGLSFDTIAERFRRFDAGTRLVADAAAYATIETRTDALTH